MMDECVRARGEDRKKSAESSKGKERTLIGESIT
jgi:hypothetical protein